MGGSDAPSVTPDGRYVAFDSYASDLVQSDGNFASDVFVQDLVAGTTERASVDTGGEDPDGFSFIPSLSADGRYVAFHSFATDLVQSDGNFAYDVFVRDLVAGTTVQASVDTGGETRTDSAGIPRSAPTAGTWRSPRTPPTWSKGMGTASSTSSSATP